MIEFTEQALIKASERVRLQEKPGIRFALLGGGCAGFQYDFNYADGPEDGDIEQSVGDFKVWICPISNKYLDGTKIEWLIEGVQEGFKFVNPLESTSCGCGVSVGFEVG